MVGEEQKEGNEERLGVRLKKTRDSGVYRFFEQKTPKDIVATLVDERKVGTAVKDRLYLTAEVFSGVIRQVKGLEAMISEHELPLTVTNMQASVGAALRQLVLLTEDYELELDAKERAMEGLAQKLTSVQAKRLEDIRQKRELYIQIMTDPLTGLYSRRFFFTDLPEKIRIAEKHNEPLSIIVYDLNNFKKVNDTYGHDAGDFVLKEISKVAREVLPKAYILARTGGDEFSIILPKATEIQAHDAAEKLRLSVKEHSMIYTLSDDDNEYDYKIEGITIALGVKQLEFGEGADDLYHGADAAFYVAHKKGKDRTVKYSDFEQHFSRMPTDEAPVQRPPPIAIRPRQNEK
jgi:diguanylate cyclase (GGDEF)-like protein